MPPLVDSPPPPDNQQPDLISMLIAASHVIPNSPPIDAPEGAGEPVAWQDLEVGRQYWHLTTGFGAGNYPANLFTVTEIMHFPNGGAMILTDVPAIAYGCGADCESLIGPRNRFWATRFWAT